MREPVSHEATLLQQEFSDRALAAWCEGVFGPAEAAEAGGVESPAPWAWRPPSDSCHWLGDPEAWKPDAELDVVKLFQEEDTCACGGPIKNWRVDRAEQEVRFNCSNPDCSLGAWSPGDDFLGSFGGWDDDPDGDGDIPVMLAF